jgi:hypothetical protein
MRSSSTPARAPRTASRQLLTTKPARPAAALAALALTASAALAGASAALAAGPLSPARFSAAPVCPAPVPGRAACLGVALDARAPLSLPGARALGSPPRNAAASSPLATENTQPIGGIAPGELRRAYKLDSASALPTTQTIAIVDAYHDPTAAADLAHFSSQFGLAACSAESNCFREVNEQGKPFPLPVYGGTSEERAWALETATDIETVHAVCPNCHILLVEASSNSTSDLSAGENAAARLGATEISNSWGGPEPAEESKAFEHPGVVITASSGDSGYLNWLMPGGQGADYPASSPHVVAVAGTRLQQSEGTWQSESVWNDGGEEAGEKTGAGASGGGCSSIFAAPAWQAHAALSVGCPRRAVADVAADGDPYTGVDVYDSTPTQKGSKGWTIVGGTSVSSPIISAVFALAGGAHGVAYPAQTLYENAAAAPGGFHDVTAGSNGRCAEPVSSSTGASTCTSAEEGAASCSGATGMCVAGAGYDGASGLGTPRGIAAFQRPGEAKELPGGEEASNVTGEGGSKAGSSSGGGAGGAGAGAGQAPTAQASASEEQAPEVVSADATATVSGLTLSRGASLAHARRGSRTTRVDFAFALSAPARVSVVLSKWARSRRGGRWRAATRPVSLIGVAARQSARLELPRPLPAGRYELTITPTLGAGSSVIFQLPRP